MHSVPRLALSPSGVNSTWFLTVKINAVHLTGILRTVVVEWRTHVLGHDLGRCFHFVDRLN